MLDHLGNVSAREIESKEMYFIVVVEHIVTYFFMELVRVSKEEMGGVQILVSLLLLLLSHLKQGLGSCAFFCLLGGVN